MTKRDKDAERWARDMVQRFGWEIATSRAAYHRSDSVEGTYTFAHWNRVCQALALLRTVGRV